MSIVCADDRRGGPASAVFLFLILSFLPSAAPAGGDDEWTVIARPTTRDLRRADFIDPMTGWAAGDSGTVIMTSDGGLTWVEQNSNTEFDIIDISIVGGQYGWIVSQQYPVDTSQAYGTELLRTTDGGENWEFVTRFDQFYYHSVKFLDSQNGFLGGNFGRIEWTEDGGNIWNPAVIDSPAFAMWPIWRFDFHSPGLGLAMGGLFDVTGLVWKTTDGGKFWTHRRVAGEPIFACHFFDSLDILCVSGDIDFGSGMVRTVDGGDNWEYTYLGIWGQATGVAFRTPTEGWAPLGFAGTYMKTTDAGSTWTSTFTPDSTGMFDVLFPDSVTGYMVGARGTILKWIPPPVSVGSPAETLPETARLLQNHPNPFNASTTIEFRLPAASQVSLRVFDLTGREVATVVDGRLPAGLHRKVFDGTSLSSGLYFYRLVAGEHRETRKMVLLK